MVPGLVAVNRTNPSQDPRISIRGFGARSTFGVRGVRILRDGMPLTLPDGQTPVDYLSLESVGKIEVIRGAASALYGNASGGIVNLRTSPPPSVPLSGEVRQWLGDYGLSRTTIKGGGISGPAYYQADASLTQQRRISRVFPPALHQCFCASRRDSRRHRLRNRSSGIRLAAGGKSGCADPRAVPDQPEAGRSAVGEQECAKGRAPDPGGTERRQAAYE